jgi:hypothetical protein
VTPAQPPAQASPSREEVRRAPALESETAQAAEAAQEPEEEVRPASAQGSAAARRSLQAR